MDYQLDAAASEADLGQDPGEVGRGESHMIGIGMLVVIGLHAKKY